jgi:hypothetical protein
MASSLTYNITEPKFTKRPKVLAWSMWKARLAFVDGCGYLITIMQAESQILQKQESDMINVRSKKWVGCRLQSTIMQREKDQILWRAQNLRMSQCYCWRLLSQHVVRPANYTTKRMKVTVSNVSWGTTHRTVSQELQGQRYAVVEYILEQFPGVGLNTLDWRVFSTDAQTITWPRGSGLPSIDDRSRRGTVIMIAAARTNG